MQSNQTQAGKILPPTRPDSQARVFRQAFARFTFLINTHIVGLLSKASANKLRVKTGKTGWPVGGRGIVTAQRQLSDTI
ncbi:hypothetical protein [Mucilaginibacter sp.]|uniref:hypothetical protein n=1 Tax=Mucilaginibacter sp. TaxID=1882438 RepID=UPI00261ACAD2|nr:hypothetical protein [Mucilaginibacter sp.]